MIFRRKVEGMRFTAKYVLLGIAGILSILLLRITMKIIAPYPAISGAVLPETSALAEYTAESALADSKPAASSARHFVPIADESALLESKPVLTFFEELASLDRDRLQQASIAEVRKRAWDFISTGIALGMEPEALAAELIPSSGHIVAMLIDSRDSEEFSQIDGVSLPAKLSYQRIAALNPLMAPLRLKFEAIFDSAYAIEKKYGRVTPFRWFEPDAARWQGGITLPGKSSLPRLSDLDYSHTYALDIFFQDVQYLAGNIQRGPVIHSLSDGIVVAAETGWVGVPRIGERLSYLTGGISPKSGNGIIIYAPDEHKYYSYFHLHDIFVRKGQLVRAGQPLGHGGNSGINARKKGGGEHLHLEVFDANAGKFLPNTQLIALLKASIKRRPAVPQE